MQVSRSCTLNWLPNYHRKKHEYIIACTVTISVRYAASCVHRKQTYDTTTTKQLATTPMYETRTRRIQVHSTPSTRTQSDVIIMTIESHENYQRRSGGSEPNTQLTLPGGATACCPTILAQMMVLLILLVS